MLGAITDNATLRSLYFSLLQRLQPNICCDIGANDGQAALLAREASGESVVYAFEANPEIHALHQARLAAAGVQYLNLALSDRSGEVTVFAPRTLSKSWRPEGLVEARIAEPATTGKTSLFRRAEEATYAEFNVRSQTLDEFFGASGQRIEKSSFALWIDAEGAAAQVLAGAEAVLRSVVAIFVEVEGYKFWKGQRMAADVAEFLKERGFVPVARDREYGGAQFNILFVRPESVAMIEKDIASLVAYPSRDLPVVIPCFNNPTYLREMVAQLVGVGLGNLIILDNSSEFPPHLAYLESIEGEFTVIRRKKNDGPRFPLRDAAFYNALPQYFGVTDPDLELNPNLPADFVQSLIDLTDRYRVGKAGFCLDISEPAKMRPEHFQIGLERFQIWQWEAQFWQTPLQGPGEDPIYRAPIDTTFAIYNKAFFRPESHIEAIRVGGRYTARHLPWYIESRVPAAEEGYYRATSKHSFYGGTPPSS